MKTLHKTLQWRNVMFQHNHAKPMSCTAAAQLLSNTLYYKRFFPYFTFNLLAGLDDEGEFASRAVEWGYLNAWFVRGCTGPIIAYCRWVSGDLEAAHKSSMSLIGEL
jgi:hypothetical protein